MEHLVRILVPFEDGISLIAHPCFPAIADGTFKMQCLKLWMRSIYPIDVGSKEKQWPDGAKRNPDAITCCSDMPEPLVRILDGGKIVRGGDAWRCNLSDLSGIRRDKAVSFRQLTGRIWGRAYLYVRCVLHFWICSYLSHWFVTPLGSKANSPNRSWC